MALINVSDGNSAFSLWTENDSGLTLETLNSVIPNATNLINASNEQERVYLSIHNGKIFNPDGWDTNIVYLAHLGSSRPPTPAASEQGNFHIATPEQGAQTLDINTEFKEVAITDHLAELAYHRCRKYICFSKLVGFDANGATPIYDAGKNLKFVVTICTDTYAVTAMHCLRKISGEGEETRRDAQLEDEFEIFSCEDPTKSFLVSVCDMHLRSDLAVLKLKSGTFPHCPVLAQPEKGVRAVCLGYPSFEDIREQNLVMSQASEREPVPISVQICALNTPGPNMFAVACGLAQGFSGGGLFRVYGQTDFVVGMCTRGRIPPKDWFKINNSWIHRRSMSYFISGSAIFESIEVLEEPTFKKLKL